MPPNCIPTNATVSSPAYQTNLGAKVLFGWLVVRRENGYLVASGPQLLNQAQETILHTRNVRKRARLYKKGNFLCLSTVLLLLDSHICALATIGLPACNKVPALNPNSRPMQEAVLQEAALMNTQHFVPIINTDYRSSCPVLQLFYCSSAVELSKTRNTSTVLRKIGQQQNCLALECYVSACT